MVTLILTTVFLVSIGDPYVLLTMSIAEFEDKNDIAQSGGTEGKLLRQPAGPLK